MVKYTLVMAKRRWNDFPGNNRFFCDGRLITARQFGILAFVVIAILVIAVLFMAFDARFLVLNIHPVGVGVIFPVIGIAFTFYALAYVLKAGCTDPGIVPRAYPDEVAYNLSLGTEDSSNTAKGYLGTPARYRTVTVNGVQIKLKYCVTCKLWRPPRASHCGLCNNCLEQFDHHCPWTFDHHCPVVGNCVAKRNYRYFYLFLVTMTIGTVYVMGCNVAVIVVASKQNGFLYAIKTYPARYPSVLFLFLFLFFTNLGLGAISVSGLAMMHTWLIARMETTNEEMKGSFRSRPGQESALNPYVTSRNCFENFCIVVCGPFTPSLIGRRDEVDVEGSVLEEENNLECSVTYGATTILAEKTSDHQTAAQSTELNRRSHPPEEQSVIVSAEVHSEKQQLISE
ncbi:hypothetical protein EMCRGX_G034591 [Ephydatia muelleri]